MNIARVLDHGYCQLIDSMGDDNEALRDARMSTSTVTGVDPAKDDKLRNRLLRDFHTSPFEGTYAKFELQLPLFCLRQIDRHRTVDDVGCVIESSDEVPRQFMSRNEFSGRYSEMPDLFYVPRPELIRQQSTTNKQSSVLMTSIEKAHYADRIEASSEQARVVYDHLIRDLVGREQARMVLPMNQYTKVRLSGSCLSWMKFFKLRLQPDVQWETRQYTKAMARQIRDLWPRTWRAFEDQWLYTKTIRRADFLVNGTPGLDFTGLWKELTSVDLLAIEEHESWDPT